MRANRIALWIILATAAWGTARAEDAKPPGNAGPAPVFPPLKVEDVDPDVLRKVRKLIKATLSEEAEERDQGWQGVRDMGNLAVPGMLALTQQPETTVDMAAQIVIALGDSKDPRAGPALAAVLNHKERVIRVRAARALGDAKFKGALAALRAKYEDAKEDDEVRLYAAVSAAKFGAKEAHTALVEMTKAPKPEMRSRAVFNLARYGGKAHLETVAKALEDPDETVRADALEGLRAIGGADAGARLVKALLDPSRKIRDEARTIFQQDKGLLPGLTKALKADDAKLREAAARALGDTRHRDALTPLKDCYADFREGEPVRLAAAVAACKLGDKEVFASLRALVKADAAAVRAGALAALGRYAGPCTREALAALGDRDAGVRCQAALTIQDGRDRAACPGLIKALDDGDEAVRLAVIAALKELTGEDLESDAGKWKEWWAKEGRQAWEQAQKDAPPKEEPKP